MRLCALAQPAHIRMTRRRSVPPSPSSRIPKEDQQQRTDPGDLTPVAPYQLRSSARARLRQLQLLVRRRALSTKGLAQIGDEILRMFEAN
jgi:hypothetical protein